LVPRRPERTRCRALHPLNKEPQDADRTRHGAASDLPQDRNLFAKLKDWRRIATRYDRCAHTFFSAISIAATFAFYLNQ